MFAYIIEREISIMLVIALLVAGGSQLPNLVRALARSSPPDRSTDKGDSATRTRAIRIMSPRTWLSKGCRDDLNRGRP